MKLKYAKIGDKLCPMYPQLSRKAEPIQRHFEDSDFSLYEQWLAYAFNSFQNPFAKANEILENQVGWWRSITRDRIIEVKEAEKGKLQIRYQANSGLSDQREYTIPMPKMGWYVPNQDCMPKGGLWLPFYPGTGIPFETVGDFDVAMKRFWTAGIPESRMAYFYRNESFNGDEIVSRHYDPLWGTHGRFAIYTGYRPENIIRNGGVFKKHAPEMGEPDVVYEVPFHEA